jgi:hypothetical protein
MTLGNHGAADLQLGAMEIPTEEKRNSKSKYFSGRRAGIRRTKKTAKVQPGQG